MSINKATMLKMQKQQAKAQYEKKIRAMCSHQPTQLYDVFDGTTIIARVPIERCAQYAFGYKFIPVANGQEALASA